MPHLMLEKNVVVRIDDSSGTNEPENMIEWIELSDEQSANIDLGDLYYSSNGLHLTTNHFYEENGKINFYTNETKLENIREIRNGNLKRSDWTVLPDSPLTDAKKAEWQTYRQQLRDLPTSNTNPFDIDFPAEPS